MIYKKLFLFFYSYILAIVACIAQETPSYFIRHFTDEDGLPQNSIKSIAPDQHGFIWLTTEDGLVRFDGETFKRFGKENIPVSSNRFGNLYFGGGGKKLFVTNDWQEQVRIESGSAKLDQQSATPAEAWFRYFPEDRDTDTANTEVNAFQAVGLPNRRKRYLHIRQNILHAQDGGFYICRMDSLFFSREGRTVFGLAFRPADIWNFFLLDEQLHYIYPDGSISRFTTAGEERLTIRGALATESEMKKLPVTVFWNVCVRDHILVSVGNNIYSLRADSRGKLASRLILSGFEMEACNIYSAYYDEKKSMLYLGSETKGLYVFSGKQFRTLTSGIGEDVYYAQAAYKDNTILTSQGIRLGLSVKPSVFPFLRNLMEIDFYSIFTDHGDIWTKRDDKIYKIKDATWQQAGEWQLPGEVTILYKGAGDMLWIGTRKHGLYQMGMRQAGNGPALCIPSLANISYIQDAGNGRLWIGTGGGLYRWDTGLKKLDTIRGLQDNYIRSIYLSAPDEVWITTYENGFYLYKDEKLVTFPLDKDRFLSAAHCIIEDRKGYFWVTTNKGLFQLSKADLLRYASGRQEHLYYHYYDKHEGFNTNEFNGGCQPCAVRLDNGYISLPSLNGLVLFNPDSLQTRFPDKELFIDGIELNRRKIGYTELTRLPREFEQLSFQVSTPFMGNRRNVYMMYALVRSDPPELWLTVPEDGTISLSTLPAGDYTLLVRKLNGFGEHNYTERSIRFTVAAAWYQTAWFYGACILLLAACCWVFLRLRLRYIKKRNVLLEQGIAMKTKELLRQNDIQEKIIRSVSHDIRTPLKYQLLLAKKIHEGLLKEQSAQAASAKVMSDYTHRLYHMVENLLKYLKVQIANTPGSHEHFALYALTEEKCMIFSEIAQVKGTRITNHVAPDLFATGDEQLLGVILHNLLDNAVKVTRNGFIDIRAQYQEGRLLIEVSDTGPGLSKALQQWINQADMDMPSPQQSGIGLLMVRELTAMLGISLQVVAETGKGTIFRIIY